MASQSAIATPRERPILFSAPMVRAILEGRKTQTRRIVKPQPALSGSRDPMWGHEKLSGYFAEHVFGSCMAKLVSSPYGAPGDRLWVKETIRRGPTEECPRYEYRDTATYAADGAPTKLDTWPWKTNPLRSIHCPRGLSRINLEITGVRVERLQQITEADAKAEGATPFPYDPEGDCWTDGKSRTAFEHLWNEINGWTPPAWQANPWVWVVEFRRVP